MLKRKKENPETGSQLFRKSAGEGQGTLAQLMDGYSKLLIDDPVRPFRESHLQDIENNVDYGILAVLDGTWVSYNANYNKNVNTPSLASGIHTTIMPSPGTNSGTIPGKFSFDCEEYIEKLTFSIVPGGVRNRGGASELFCGAVKYEQTIKSVTMGERQSLKYTPIHEENGMYLWLSDVYNHAATKESIERDRGIHAFSNEDYKNYGYEGEYRDEPLLRISPDGEEKKYILQSELQPGQLYYEIIPAQELKPGAGLDGPYFIPDYSISRSGVIPHGSTITLLGDILPQGKNYLVKGSPKFPDGEAAWDPDHLAISPTMGNAGVTPDDIIDLDQPAPAWVHEKLTDENDPGSNRIYTQRILADDLYPYSVRPDLRLRDTLRGQEVRNYVHVKMSSKMKTGAQGGILNVPFVNRFVPTVEVDMDMWIETVVENGKEILQLQYEQIVFFEFDFGNDGGTTSWPHIQVNTLRKLEDIPEDQRKVIEAQFFNQHQNITSGNTANPPQGCPYHKE
ncbi:peroxidase, FMP-type [Chryseobacterium arthrosphaerae]|uniref:peroxidase, FMP-type n=1 Tax=Chryseobacterium arthrosphaerae TaxID=651561 RepID=UPI0023E289CD|nr:peroxidase, FMP-type [Chryseobacterium arthrosphaerae]WES99276.1 peroxidase, FMP-type [Chryseobacterium arthrosphaerae]